MYSDILFNVIISEINANIQCMNVTYGQCCIEKKINVDIKKDHVDIKKYNVDIRILNVTLTISQHIYVVHICCLYAITYLFVCRSGLDASRTQVNAFFLRSAI